MLWSQHDAQAFLTQILMKQVGDKRSGSGKERKKISASSRGD